MSISQCLTNIKPVQLQQIGAIKMLQLKTQPEPDALASRVFAWIIILFVLNIKIYQIFRTAMLDLKLLISALK